ncbi:MAG TPA: hypothetical protein VIO94_03320 [Phenylobacterium sp.]
MRMVEFASIALSPQLRAWRGEAPLGEVFWVQGAFVSLTIALGFAAAFLAGDRSLALQLLLVFLSYTAWVVVAIWRCAERRPDPRWSPIAQALAIAWSANALLVSTSLALALR